jgi:hypothetical protein
MLLFLHLIYLIAATCFVHVLDHLQVVILNASHVTEIFQYGFIYALKL